MRHVVIIPARNEAERISITLASLLAQSEKPDRIVVVDDGSSDVTPELVGALSRADPSVVLLRRADRGKRAMGGAVVEAFNVGYQSCRDETFDYISKFDADLEFPADYCARLLAVLDRQPDVGAAGGVLLERIGGRTLRLRTPREHVVGALKTIRKPLFDRMGGFLPVSGWDIIDLVKIRSLGYRTTCLDDLEVVHLRQHGTAEGALRGRADWGRGAYVIGSHPLFVLGRGLYRMVEPPYVAGGLAFWWGYLRAALGRTAQIEDRALVRALRREQLQRLLRSNRLGGA